MAKIMDWNTSRGKRANSTFTWAWEVITQEYNYNVGEYQDNIVARFFDPWKAVQYSIDKYKGMCAIQAVLLPTANLTKDERGEKV